MVDPSLRMIKVRVLFRTLHYLFRMHLLIMCIQQWRCQHQNFRGGGIMGTFFRGARTSKSHQFWPICTGKWKFFLVSLNGGGVGGGKCLGEQMHPLPPLTPPLAFKIIRLILESVIRPIYQKQWRVLLFLTKKVFDLVPGVFVCVVHLGFLTIITRLELCISWTVCVAQWLERPTCTRYSGGPGFNSPQRQECPGFFLGHSCMCSGFVINVYSIKG